MVATHHQHQHAIDVTPEGARSTERITPHRSGEDARDRGESCAREKQRTFVALQRRPRNMSASSTEAKPIATADPQENPVARPAHEPFAKHEHRARFARFLERRKKEQRTEHRGKRSGHLRFRIHA